MYSCHEHFMSHNAILCCKVCLYESCFTINFITLLYFINHFIHFTTIVCEFSCEILKILNRVILGLTVNTV